MFIQFLILAVFQHYGASMPIIPNTIDAREAPQSGAVIVQNQKMRTHFDILWSCVSTLFICTWVAIHPNIPPRDEGHIWSLWRRIKLMLWTLLVPELILIWAYRQWSTARYIAEYFKDEGWTPTHGHFLIMGGFIFDYVDDSRSEGRELVLGFHEFQSHLGLLDDYPNPQIAFPMITASEIRDKARGDFLSKAIVILQSFELELVTVALASLNGVMYFFWWDKPLGVMEPIKLYATGKGPMEKLIQGGSEEDRRRQQQIENSSKRSLVQMLIDIIRPIQFLRKDFCTMFASHRQLSSISLVSINQFLKDQRNCLGHYIPFVDHLWFLYLPIYWFIWIPIEALAVALRAIADTRYLHSRSYVPTFYAPSFSTSSDIFIFPVLLLTPIIFGALHCIGWNFHFPSHVEQLLWRIGSLSITLLPIPLPLFLALVLADHFIKKLCHIELSKFLGFLIPDAIAIIFVGVSVIAYMIARLLLLTLAFVLLRRQPESAFYAINWASFLPHI